MQKTVLIPTAISSLRIAAIPIFFYLYNVGNIAGCLVLFAFAVATDWLDGYLARKLKVTTKTGAYYDAATDFALVFGIYSLFTFKGFYPVWLLIIIATAFIQFVATSPFATKIYDPVGRYIGSALYIGIVLTLVFPMQTIFLFVQYAFVVFFAVSLASRTISLVKNRHQETLS